mmetsp:Transcript_2542/g.6908  ORF Transcript_2542/g.6908 Transcript_2542/m.6908 type:complete len:155 (-) Transcript_2542:926-1390(-)
MMKAVDAYGERRGAWGRCSHNERNAALVVRAVVWAAMARTAAWAAAAAVARAAKPAASATWRQYIVRDLRRGLVLARIRAGGDERGAACVCVCEGKSLQSGWTITLADAYSGEAEAWVVEAIRIGLCDGVRQSRVRAVPQRSWRRAADGDEDEP